MLFDVVFLFGAGLLGGFINSLAGGGSFITFPALLFVGVAPVSANATNTFASFAGYLSGTYAFRNELQAHKQKLLPVIVLSLVGGALGAWLLIQTPEALFTDVIPWLLLFATLLFAFGKSINSILKRVGARHKHASLVGSLLLSGFLLLICVYGGFFNAGLGIVALSYLALAGYKDINAMNGIKLLISSVVSVIAIALFIADGAIAWREGLLVLFGALFGGYISAHISRRVPQHYVRFLVIFAGFNITAYFFIKTYA